MGREEMVWSSWPVMSWNDSPGYRERFSILTRGTPCACSPTGSRTVRHVSTITPDSELPYHRGDRFMHPRFGNGVVWHCERRSGDCWMTVVFTGRKGVQRFWLSGV
jgi:hypothetical protein